MHETAGHQSRRGDDEKDAHWLSRIRAVVITDTDCKLYHDYQHTQETRTLTECQGAAPVRAVSIHTSACTKSRLSATRFIALEELQHITVAGHCFRTKTYEIIFSHRDRKFGQIVVIEEVQMGHALD